MISNTVLTANPLADDLEHVIVERVQIGSVDGTIGAVAARYERRPRLCSCRDSRS